MFGLDDLELLQHIPSYIYAILILNITIVALLLVHIHATNSIYNLLKDKLKDKE